MEGSIWQVAVTVCVGGLLVIEVTRIASELSAEKRANQGNHSDKKASDRDGKAEDL